MAETADMVELYSFDVYKSKISINNFPGGAGNRTRTFAGHYLLYTDYLLLLTLRLECDLDDI